MTDASGRSDDERSAKAELKALLKSILKSIEYSSEDQHGSLLKALREWQKGEQRKGSRKACSVSVTVTAGTWRVTAESIRNISTGGVFIETSAPFSPGEHVKLMFSSPDEKAPVEVTGEIVWKSPQGIGVKFTQPLTEEFQQLV